MKRRRSQKHSAGRRPKGGRSDGDTRVQILAAARRVFAQRGLDGTSVREVAYTARVNNAMIYYHFKDKDALYRAVLSDSFSTLIDIWNDPIFTSKTSVRRKIQKYVESFIHFQIGNEDLRRIMAMEFAGSSRNITWICEHYFADNYAGLVKLLREGMKSGELKKFDPSLAVTSLIGVIIHNFILQPLAEHVHGKCVNLSSKKFGAFVTDLFFNGLARAK
ncbi:MAG TPA: TetR/AcrR family transcriptional regulator [Nitrospirota bacterium]|nr:TetR/AcrR family transcriptional regulator [Nitrospirota bacterium]